MRDKQEERRKEYVEVGPCYNRVLFYMLGTKVSILGHPNKGVAYYPSPKHHWHVFFCRVKVDKTREVCK